MSGYPGQAKPYYPPPQDQYPPQQGYGYPPPQQQQPVYVVEQEHRRSGAENCCQLCCGCLAGWCLCNMLCDMLSCLTGALCCDN